MVRSAGLALARVSYRVPSVSHAGLMVGAGSVIGIDKLIRPLSQTPFALLPIPH